MPALNATGLKTEGDLTKDEFVPSGFLDTNGMCVLPSFYQPETESLRWATHNNIRRTMFHHVWRSVKYVEYLRLQSESDSFDFNQVTPGRESWFDIFVETYISGEKKTGRLL